MRATKKLRDDTAAPIAAGDAGLSADEIAHREFQQALSDRREQDALDAEQDLARRR